MTSKILIVDEHRALHDLISTLFPSEFEVYLRTDKDSALQCISAERLNVAIIDIDSVAEGGLDVLQEAKNRDPGLAVIMAATYKSTSVAMNAMKAGAFDYITKPFRGWKLKDTVERALECNLHSRRVRYARDYSAHSEVDHDEDVMIGSSPEMVEVWKMIGTVANSDASVLIQGESGTGKELLARAIYSTSMRKNRPFLVVNCAALPETLLESELFGHEKGAFTDAHTRRVGKFEQCNGGTLFLDEVSEMSPASQAKFLRVLENHEFERVGGNETVKVDVRIISATNRSLIDCVKEKAFRLDLFYRLRVLNFFLPPLREREEDIPLLVQMFVNLYSQKYGKSIVGVAPEAMKLLQHHHWPGNIRELKNVINCATILCRGNIIVASDVEQIDSSPPEFNFDPNGDCFCAAFQKMLGPMFDQVSTDREESLYDHMIAALEKALIHLAIEKTGSELSAARTLGISRNTLRSRLRKYRATGQG